MILLEIRESGRDIEKYGERQAGRQRSTDKTLDVCENNLRKHYIFFAVAVNPTWIYKQKAETIFRGLQVSEYRKWIDG